MREAVTDTFCTQWVEDYQLRSVPCPPHLDFSVGTVLSVVEEQVPRAVKEKRKSDSVLLRHICGKCKS